MKDTINLRVKLDGMALTLIPDPATHGDTMQSDVRSIALEWMKHLDINLKPDALAEARYEFVMQSTLTYIAKLEGVLERLQSDPDTSDALLEEIEGVLQ